MSPSPAKTDLSLLVLVLACYWLGLVYQLGAQWSAYEQYNYGWAVPFLCLYLVWARTAGRDAECQMPPSTSPSVPWSAPFSIARPPAAFSSPSLLYLLLAGVALLYAPTRLLHEANPIWRLTSLLLALEVIALTLLCWHLFGSSRFALRTLHLAFPIGFFLVAVPWPSGLENFLVQTFTGLNVFCTTELLNGCGIPALQHGNTIEVGTGMVGIDEACSGIRSFQATLMIALFFGEFYRLNLQRRVACVLSGFALSFLFNLSRTTLLTWVAARQGTAAMARWHDPAGVAILVLCFLSLWLIALSLAASRPGPVERSTGTQDGGWRTGTSGVGEGNRGSCEVSDTQPTRPGPPASTLRRFRFCASGLLLWFICVEAGTELWYRSHERGHVAASQWRLQPQAMGPGFQSREVPPNIARQFHADENLQARWQDEAGNPWQLYYFRWQPARALRRRVAVQLAKTHGPEKCLPGIGMVLKSYLGVIHVPLGQTRLALQQYVFMAEDKPVHVFYGIYEDSTGPGVLANRRQTSASRLTAALAGSRNYGQSYLELAVSGPTEPQEARDALQRQLGRLIRF